MSNSNKDRVKWYNMINYGILDHVHTFPLKATEPLLINKSSLPLFFIEHVLLLFLISTKINHMSDT